LFSYGYYSGWQRTGSSVRIFRDLRVEAKKTDGPKSWSYRGKIAPEDVERLEALGAAASIFKPAVKSSDPRAPVPPEAHDYSPISVFYLDKAGKPHSALTTSFNENEPSNAAFIGELQAYLRRVTADEAPPSPGRKN